MSTTDHPTTPTPSPTDQPPDAGAQLVATLQAAHLQHYDLADKIADAHRRLHAALRDDTDRAQRWRTVAAAQAQWYRAEVAACLTHASDHDTTPVDADKAVTA